MTRLSPSTLSVIAAALSVERGFSNASHSQIEQALQALLPGNTSGDNSSVLRPGEYFLVKDEEDCYNDLEEYHVLEAFEHFANEMQDDMENRDFDDRFSVYIVRKKVAFQIERKTRVIMK